MYPHERSLVKQMQDKPFVLLGVNSDGNLNVLKDVIQSENINWRSWWDGQAGPITRAWQVTTSPTIYLIDHKGIIRKRYVGAPREAVLEQILNQMLSTADGEPE